MQMRPLIRQTASSITAQGSQLREMVKQWKLQAQAAQSQTIKAQ
jgi:hypothetical protein